MISWVEHDERLAAVYAARTGHELEPWLADLPMRAAGAAIEVESLSPPLRVVLGKVRRRPDPGAGSVQVDVALGAAVLDLRDLPPGCVLDVVANSLLGKVEVHVSAGTRVIDSGTAALGKRSTVERRAARRVGLQSDAPVVRLGGHSLLGHVRVTIA